MKKGIVAGIERIYNKLHYFQNVCLYSSFESTYTSSEHYSSGNSTCMNGSANVVVLEIKCWKLKHT